MDFHNTPEMRDNIRERLQIYMDSIPLSAEQVAAFIEDHRSDLAPRANSKNSKVAIDHGVISRFLRARSGTQPYKVEILYRYLVYERQILDPTIRFENRSRSDPVFQLIHDFFGVRENNIALCRSLVGTYSLFFRSEDLHNRVVRGAITFDTNQDGDAFKIFEHQENKGSGAVERWHGYYVARRTRLIIVMRGEGILDNMPKFYILNTPHTDKDGLAAETGGMMLKIGNSGSAVFSAKVLLRRDGEAVSKCDVLSASNISDDILNEI